MYAQIGCQNIKIFYHYQSIFKRSKIINYFHIPSKLFSSLYLATVLDISAKRFFSYGKRKSYKEIIF